MKITPATEALRLPCAQLTDEEHKIVDKIVLEINNGIQEGMKLNGFNFSTNNTDPAAMAEVVYRLQEAGYLVQCQANVQPNRLNPRGPAEIVGFMLAVGVPREAITASRQTLQ